MRHDDHEKKCYFRSSGRIFKMNGEWYFAAREGDRGPFQSEAEAAAEVKRFICEQIDLSKFQKARESARKAPHKLELVALDDRPYDRPKPRERVSRKVLI